MGKELFIIEGYRIWAKDRKTAEQDLKKIKEQIPQYAQ